jgi:hypothetical protein
MWPWTKWCEKSTPSISENDLCCLNKKKEAAIKKQALLEEEIEARLRKDHPEYAAYEKLLADIIESQLWRRNWSAYQEGKSREESSMVMCAELALISDLNSAKERYRKQILEEDCKKGESLFTLRT